MSNGVNSVEDLIDQIEDRRKDELSITFGEVLDAIGRRSFGPLLIVAGIIVLAPIIGDIPGMPTVTAVFVALVAAQIAAGRRHVWLPDWMLSQSVEATKLDAPLRWLRKLGTWLDRITHTRLHAFAGETAARIVAGTCILLAATMPIMEVVPFSANAAGLVLLMFGVALVASDGLIVLLATAITMGTFGVLVWWLLK